MSEIAAPFEAHSGDRGRGACGLYPWSPPSSAPAPQPGQFRAHRAPPAPGPGTPIDRAGWALSPCLALAEGRRFISDQSRRKDLADRPPPGECAGVREPRATEDRAGPEGRAPPPRLARGPSRGRAGPARRRELGDRKAPPVWRWAAGAGVPLPGVRMDMRAVRLPRPRNGPPV